MAGVTIGDGAIIWARAVVTKDVPPSRSRAATVQSSLEQTFVQRDSDQPP